VEEKARVAAQKAALGEAGLARAMKLLDDAKRENERPIPSEMLTSFPVPPVGSIFWIPVQSATSSQSKREPNRVDNELTQHLSKDGTQIPHFVQFDHVKVTSE
jgi:hypothetical protein